MPKLNNRPMVMLSFQVEADLMGALEIRARMERRTKSAIARMILEDALRGARSAEKKRAASGETKPQSPAV